jgi:hypothetical protein
MVSAVNRHVHEWSSVKFLLTCTASQQLLSGKQSGFIRKFTRLDITTLEVDTCMVYVLLVLLNSNYIAVANSFLLDAFELRLYFQHCYLSSHRSHDLYHLPTECPAKVQFGIN